MSKIVRPLLPGQFIVIVVPAFNFLGDGLAQRG